MTLDQAIAGGVLLSWLAEQAAVPCPDLPARIHFTLPSVERAATELGEGIARRFSGWMDGPGAAALVAEVEEHLALLRDQAAAYQHLLAKLEERHGQTCRVCGCSTMDPCWDETAGGCSWVEDDLCSACTDLASALEMAL